MSTHREIVLVPHAYDRQDMAIQICRPMCAYAPLSPHRRDTLPDGAHRRAGLWPDPPKDIAMETELLAEARDLLEAVVADNGAASVFGDYRGTDGYICGFCSASAPEVSQIAHIPA